MVTTSSPGIWKPRRNIERKHLRVDLRRADRLVPHQGLQSLQRDAGA